MATLTEQKSRHQHGPGCGHIAVEHHGHSDYLQDGHLEHMEGNRVSEHKVEVDQQHPDRCTYGADGHPKNHVHGPIVVMRRCHTVITSTIWSMAICTIPTATIATNTET